MRDETIVLGLPFDTVSEEDTLAILRRACEENKQCFLSTPNLNFAIGALKSSSFRDSVLLSDLSIADGAPLVLTARLIGETLPERVAGSSVFQRLSNSSSNEPMTVFFFGGDDGIADIAREKLNKLDGGLFCVGAINPGRGSVEDMSSETIINQINQADPDFLVVALGAKKGQEWILANKDRLNARIISHLGAVVNFVAGNVSRAPVIWQKLGAEWIWRIIEEPYLWVRYASDGLHFSRLLLTNVFPLAIYKRMLEAKFGSHPLESTVIDSSESENATLVLSGSAHRNGLQELKVIIQTLLGNGRGVSIDLKEIQYADGAFFALLLRFKTQLSKKNMELHLVNSTKRFRRLARLYMCSGDFEELY